MKVVYDITPLSPDTLKQYETFSEKDKELFSSKESISTFDPNTGIVELHVYSPDEFILTSDYNYTGHKQILDAVEVSSKTPSKFVINPEEDLKKYGYEGQDVNLFYSFLKDYFPSTDFFIKEISGDRREILISPVENIGIEPGVSLIKSELESGITSEFRLNFQENDLIVGVNIRSNFTGEVAVRLYQELPERFSEKDLCKVQQLVAEPTYLRVRATQLVEEQNTDLKKILKGANFSIEEDEKSNNDTEYLNYNQLLSYPVTNSYYEVYSNYEQENAEISIDHTDYANFIHFSSAEERLKNFKYKVGLIEEYNNYLTSTGSISYTGYGISGSREYYETLTKGILSNFDHYERFLYFESGSLTWPKSNTNKPYILYSTGSNQADTWYTRQLALASLYDQQNPDLLLNSIPVYLREDSTNEPYNIFTHMIGQHFDNLWIYQKALSDRYNSDNRLDFGVSKDLVGELLKTFGFKLYTSNTSLDNLFGMFTGESYQSGSEVVNTYKVITSGSGVDYLQPLPKSNYQKELYKRIYHNLPLLVKAKGTERGVRALINCFGIPSDTLSIRMYGGENTQTSTYRTYGIGVTGSLDKIKTDNTGSIEGVTLSRYTSIEKRDPKYSKNLATLDIGFSPTDDLNEIIKRQITGSFNIDNYIGDPRDYNKSVYPGIEEIKDNIFNSKNVSSLRDYVRILKFIDGTLFRMLKDFVPARTSLNTGLIIKSHVLNRNKQKQTVLSYTQPEYSGSTRVGTITGSQAGAFDTTSITRTTAYTGSKNTPYGIGTINNTLYEFATLTGELSGSEFQAANRELNRNNLYKKYNTLETGSVFDNSDGNVQSNNVQLFETRPGLRRVNLDRITGTDTPTNLTTAKELSGNPAYLNLSNYTDTGWIQARYDGSSLDVFSRALADENPALSLTTYKGSIHSKDSEAISLCGGILREGERDLRDLLFYTPVSTTDTCTSYTVTYDAPVGLKTTFRWIDCSYQTRSQVISGDVPFAFTATTLLTEGPLFILQTSGSSPISFLTTQDFSEKEFYPITGSICFTVEGNQLVKLRNKKIWIKDLNIVRDTDSSGKIFYNPDYSDARGFICPIISVD